MSVRAGDGVLDGGMHLGRARVVACEADAHLPEGVLLENGERAAG